MDAGRRTADLLERRPELEDAVEAILEVDARTDEWTFDDVPIDSGAFGELVAAGVVVKADGDSYRVADPEAVRRVLTGEDIDGSSGAGEGGFVRRLRARLGGIDSGFAGLLVGTLAFVVVVRSYLFGSTFRAEHVVLSGNDPYYYRYWVETVLESGGLGWSHLTELPGSVASGEPLLVSSLAFTSSLFGGADAAGVVLAVYPVLAALVVGVMVYLMAVRVTDDRRVGFAAIAMLAVVPGHAFRTGLGYADHHAFDYVWLVLTALALVVLLDRRGGRSLRRWRTWGLAGVLAVGVTGQVLGWEGGPLLLLPIGFVIVGQGLLAVHGGRSPAAALAPVLAGLWLAGGATFAVHSLLGWHNTIIAVAPLLLAAGGTAVVALDEAARRARRTARELLLVETAVGGALAGVVWLALPSVWSTLGSAFALVTLEGSTSEAQALFSASSLGFLLIFGPSLLVVTVAFLFWATARLFQGEDSLLVPATYAWFFLLWTLFQVRFVGELAPFAALFAGLGFVWVASWVDLAATPALFSGGDRSLKSWVPARPNVRTVGYILALFALVGGIGLVQSAIKIEQLAYDDETYQTAAWIEDYAREQGWEGFGQSYVLSRWDVNRMYNYFVNGNARGYGYARSNYEEFLSETDLDSAYGSLRDRVAFIVMRNRSADPPTMQALLYDRYGSDTGRFEGSGHFRALYASQHGTYKVFHPVPGALLTGSVASNASLATTTAVTVPGASFTYERQISANETGSFEIRVAYPGTYTVRSDAESWEVRVADEAVERGERVQVGT